MAEETEVAKVETDAGTEPGKPEAETGQEAPIAALEPESEVKPDWPEDWRAKLAGEDEKLLKRLQRFQSPKNVLKSWLAAEQKISSGEAKPALPENATEEQVAEWRKANGIPETPEGYLEKLPEGLVIGEDDKPRMANFAGIAHKHNLSPAAVADMVKWSYDQQEETAAQQAVSDKEFRKTSDDELRAEWGNEYRAQINGVSSLFDSAPSGLKENLLGARLGDGSLLGDHPDALRWFASLANEINPAASVVPSTGGDMGKNVQARITEIENVMRTDRQRYEREGMRAELTKLYAAQEKIAARS